MNNTFKVIYNQSVGQWIAVSELAKGKTKSNSTKKLLLPLIATMSALASFNMANAACGDYDGKNSLNCIISNDITAPHNTIPISIRGPAPEQPSDVNLLITGNINASADSSILNTSAIKVALDSKYSNIKRNITIRYMPDQGKSISTIHSHAMDLWLSNNNGHTLVENAGTIRADGKDTNYYLRTSPIDVSFSGKGTAEFNNSGDIIVGANSAGFGSAIHILANSETNHINHSGNILGYDMHDSYVLLSPPTGIEVLAFGKDVTTQSSGTINIASSATAYGIRSSYYANNSTESHNSVILNGGAIEIMAVDNPQKTDLGYFYGVNFEGVSGSRNGVLNLTVNALDKLTVNSSSARYAQELIGIRSFNEGGNNNINIAIDNINTFSVSGNSAFSSGVTATSKGIGDVTIDIGNGVKKINIDEFRGDASGIAAYTYYGKIKIDSHAQEIAIRARDGATDNIRYLYGISGNAFYGNDIDINASGKISIDANDFSRANIYGIRAEIEQEFHKDVVGNNNINITYDGKDGGYINLIGATGLSSGISAETHSNGNIMINAKDTTINLTPPKVFMRLYVWRASGISAIVNNNFTSVLSTGSVDVSFGGNIDVQKIPGGQGIYTFTQEGDNIVTIEHGTVIGGTTYRGALSDNIGAGVSMESLGGNQVLRNSGVIGSANDLAILSKNKSGTTTVYNAGKIVGYTDIQGDAVMFNNQNGGIVALKDFSSGTKSDSVISNFGTNSIFNNEGAIEFHESNFNDSGATSGSLTGISTFNHSGIIRLSSMNAPTKQAGDKLNISGNFVTNGGLVVLDTYLGQNGGVSDQLILDSVTLGTGQTELYINPVQKFSGAISDDIELIKITNGNHNNAFKLSNTVLAGAHEYILVKNGNGWGLTAYVDPGKPGVIDPGKPGVVDPSNPWTGGGLPNKVALYRADAGTNLANQQSVIQNMIPGFSSVGPIGMALPGGIRSMTRLGGVGDKGHASSVWSYATGKSAENKAAGGQIGYDSKSYTLNIGADHSFYAGNSLFQLGIMANTSDITTKSHNVISGSRVKGNVDGYGFGLYGTWFLNGQDALSPYIDAFMNYGRYNNEVKSLGNRIAKYKADAFTFTLQGGYPIAIGSTFVIEPQLQATYVNYNAKRYIDHSGTSVKTKIDGNFVGRIGSYIYTQNKGSKPYAALNIWYDDTQSKVNYNSSAIKANKIGTVFEAKIGYQAEINSNFSIWGDIGARKGQHDYKDVNATIGIKYTW